MTTRTRRVAIDEGGTGNYWTVDSGSFVQFGGQKYVSFTISNFDFKLGGNGVEVPFFTLWSAGLLSLGQVTEEQIAFMESGQSPIPSDGNPGFPGFFFLIDYTPGFEHFSFSYGIGRADYSPPFSSSEATSAAFFTFNDSYQIILDGSGFAIVEEQSSDGEGLNGYYIGSQQFQVSGQEVEVNSPDFFTYSGTLGADFITGSEYDDRFLSSPGADTFEGGETFANLLSYSPSAAGVSVSLETGLGSGGDAEGDQISGVVDLEGSNFADTLIGDGFGNVISGLAGDDTISGGGSSDFIEGGAGADNMDGGTNNFGQDFLVYTNSPAGVTVSLSGGIGSGGDAAGDTNQNFEAIVGSAFNDTLTGSSAANRIESGNGDDTIFGLAGNDIINSGDGSDFIEPGAGADQINGGLGIDTLSYANSPAGVTLTLNGFNEPGVGGDAAGDIFGNIEIVVGSAFADSITGSGGGTRLEGGMGDDLLSAGFIGVDLLFGGEGNDGLYFGADLTDADTLDGGPGNDQLGLQGNYAGLTFGAAQLTGIEQVVLLPGNDTRFGDTAGNFYSYSLTTVDANVAAGVLFTINWNTLRAGENVTFNGSAETNGSFLTHGGVGNDTITGGQQIDGFYFGNGRFGAGDALNGQGGNDQLGLQGDYSGGNSIQFGAGQLAGIETIVLLTGSDSRFGGGAAVFSYALTMHDGNVAAGATTTVNANTLKAAEVLTFSGAAETNGAFRVFSGAGNDTIAGGAGADQLYGAAGADVLTGGAGNDLFGYISAAHSVQGAADAITDFTLGDVIDLSAIDANANTAGNDAFAFIGSNAFTNVAGQLRVEVQGNGSWLVQGDIDGDGDADLWILVSVADGPAHQPSAADFVL